MRERHPAPVQCLRVHCPERLHSLVAFVRRQLERSSSALPSTLVALGFCKDFSVLRTDFGRFRVRDRAQPTCKCCAPGSPDHAQSVTNFDGSSSSWVRASVNNFEASSMN